MTVHVGRNDPCPCGSGKKYKSCCADHRSLDPRTISGRTWGIIALVAGGIGIVVLVSRTVGQGPAGVSPAPVMNTQGAGPAAPGGPTPAPWTYDSLANRHWEPSHAHWHDGPPPPEADRVVAPARTPAAAGPAQPAPGQATPAPWTYDPATNQHWDPNHNHWHSGRPPVTANPQNAPAPGAAAPPPPVAPGTP